MPYATNSDIETRLGAQAYLQLTDDDADGSPDEAVVDEARLGAEGIVDSHLARRYAVPVDLAVYPELADVLRSVTLDLAEHALRARRPPIAPDAAARHARAINWLSAVAAGALRLPVAGEPAPSNQQGAHSALGGPDRLLGPDELNF